ncbi:MAG: TetR/AcrR family transcriptional regulator [Pseudomonadota bacterium]
MSTPPSRAALLDAAARLAAGGAWSMAELAAAVGTSRAAVYRVFPSRQALLQALQSERAVAVPPSTRERILAAAVVVLVESGLDALTVDEVARRAGVTPVTVYRHFADRDSLVEAALGEAQPREHARALSLDGDDPEEDLAAFATSTLAFLEEHGEVLRLALGAPRERLPGLARLHASPLGATRSLTVYLGRQMVAGRLPRRDPEVLAWTFVSLLLTFGCLAPAVGGPPPPSGRDLARLFLHGAGSAA